MNEIGRRIEIRGVVQGVGFRPWIYRLARAGGVGGRIHNHAEGVTIEAFGSRTAVDDFLSRIRSAPAPARLDSLRWEEIPAEPAPEFVIGASSAGASRPRVSIPPDLATCPACVDEIFDPSNRRYRYPFTCCTHCGPRFSISRAVPYDRPQTTMRSFAMCAACQREYDSPDDRRFHAQPNACPSCGPSLRAISPNGHAYNVDDPLAEAARVLRSGGIVAVKGIGGFHLACDAASVAAVRALRQRKRRDEKPFAVMVRDLAAAECLAELDVHERALLTSPERPIVLARHRPGSGLAEGVAPGNPLVGILLPYSGLHHLLLADAGRPLVMTSGNLSEEPIAYRDDEALARLGPLADLLLMHDREIETRCDDSVTRVLAGAPAILRRSRGYVPNAVHVGHRFARPVLACGAHLKNTFCIGIDDTAYLGPHIGDLDEAETLASYEESITRLEHFLETQPEVVAHDLHPEYASTAYALSRRDVVRVGVQHHHAHVASAMAEHHLEGPVIGVAYDGTGWGTDGTAWGGEILLADYCGFERLATLRPIALAGGDSAVRQVWRTALALLDDAFDGAPPPEAMRLLDRVAPQHLLVVRQMIAAGVNTALAHGAGRYFDALGALLLGRTESRYEGQVAMQLGFAAADTTEKAYPFMVEWSRDPWELDLRPLVRAVVDDLATGTPAAPIAAGFHDTLVTATATLVRAAQQRIGRVPVVLTGGCFQNARLAEGLLAALSPDFEVYLQRQVPPGDAGIALGQAVIANASLHKSAEDQPSCHSRAGDGRNRPGPENAEGAAPSAPPAGRVAAIVTAQTELRPPARTIVRSPDSVDRRGTPCA